MTTDDATVGCCLFVCLYVDPCVHTEILRSGAAWLEKFFTTAKAHIKRKIRNLLLLRLLRDLAVSQLVNSCAWGVSSNGTICARLIKVGFFCVTVCIDKKNTFHFLFRYMSTNFLQKLHNRHYPSKLRLTHHPHARPAHFSSPIPCTIGQNIIWKLHFYIY